MIRALSPRGSSRNSSEMAVRVVRLGAPRATREGLRLGTVRRPPRGVAKRDYAKLDYFDLWLPDLAPSAPLVSYALSQPFTQERWKRYARRYRREMTNPAPRRMIALLAALSSRTDFSIGCCADESCCHRSLLRELLVEQGAVLV
jgi:uncharacterized protein YeaO (DUF488 family)